MHSVLFLASENGALPGGKVGGVGDVVRDLPKALAQAGWHVRVATPSYGVLHRLSGSRRSATLPVAFRGENLEVEVWEVPTEGGVETLILHHPLFEEQGPGRIYFNGDVDRPFATDATKFALFSVAAASWIRSLEQMPDVVHLHDWHAALYLPVTNYLDEFASLRKILIGSRELLLPIPGSRMRKGLLMVLSSNRLLRCRQGCSSVLVVSTRETSFCSSVNRAWRAFP